MSDICSAVRTNDGDDMVVLTFGMREVLLYAKSRCEFAVAGAVVFVVLACLKEGDLEV